MTRRTFLVSLAGAALAACSKWLPVETVTLPKPAALPPIWVTAPHFVGQTCHFTVIDEADHDAGIWQAVWKQASELKRDYPLTSAVVTGVDAENGVITIEPA